MASTKVVLTALLGGVALFGTATLLAGCGGSAGTTSTQTKASGRAQLTVHWPERTDSRLIPFAANSIAVHLTSTDGAHDLGDALLVRPAGGGDASATFDLLPPGPITISASAYPGSDGTGVAQASATTQTAIVSGQVVNLQLVLASTISQITVTPSTAALNAGKTLALTDAASDSAGEIVLTNTSTLSWASDNPAVATVDATGKVTGVGSGIANITVTDSESGKQGTSTFYVTDPNAAPVVYDGFNYPIGTNLTGQNGGTGWSGAWTSNGYGGSTPSVIVSGLSYGHLAVSGNAFQSTSFDPIGDQRRWPLSLGKPGTTFYWSMLVQPQAVSGGYPDSYFGMNISDRYFGEGGEQTLLVIEHGGGGDIVSTGIVPQPHRTYFFVVRATFTSAGDTYDFFINPTPGLPLPATPSATKTVNHLTSPIIDFESGGSVPTTYDEWRAGPSWASVSPVAP